jgi:hypothetical protein
MARYNVTFFSRHGITSMNNQKKEETMKRIFQFLFILVIFLLVYWANISAEELTVPLTNPNAPCKLKAALHRGGITVKGYNGNQILVETELVSKKNKEGRDTGQEVKGLKRIPNTGMDLVVEEEDNLVKIYSGSLNQKLNLHIQVPFNTSLKLSCHHDGDINVDQVNGEFEIHNHHGSITLTNISGTAMANTHHGKITAAFNNINSKQPMSFTTYHGNINVTLPADTKAKLKMKSDRGDFYTDFDMKVGVSSPKIEKREKERGKYRVKVEKGVYGTINGGGVDIDLKTYHGNIYIRKGK